jgi:hypothetical protein
MGDRAVKSSGTAVGIGWVTTGVSRLASVWRGLGGVLRRIGRFGACWRGTRRVGSSPPVKELDGVSCCPWEASPPLMAEAWSPVQIHLAGSPPVGGGLPVGCLASSDGVGLVPGADPSRGEEIST